MIVLMTSNQRFHQLKHWFFELKQANVLEKIKVVQKLIAEKYTIEIESVNREET